MKIEIGEYTVIQAKNHHISIYKDGRLVNHIRGTRKYSEDELKGILGMVIKNEKV